MSTYRSLQVLDFMEPDRVGVIREGMEQQNLLLGGGIGRDVIEAAWLAPAPTRSVTFSMSGATDVALLKAFLDAVKGRVFPFWMPSYQHELTLNAAASAGASSFRVNYVNYAGLLHDSPNPAGRRHVALLRRGVANEYHYVSSATPSFGIYETLAITPNLTSNLIVGNFMGATVINFLKLFRLEQDTARIDWLTGGFARATLQLREVPLEEPQS